MEIIPEPSKDVMVALKGLTLKSDEIVEMLCELGHDATNIAVYKNEEMQLLST